MMAASYPGFYILTWCHFFHILHFFPENVALSKAGDFLASFHRKDDHYDQGCGGQEAEHDGNGLKREEPETFRRERSRKEVGGRSRDGVHLMRLHHAVVVQVLVDHRAHHLLLLIRSAHAGYLVSHNGAGGLGRWVNGHQVYYGADQHQQR